MRDDFWLEEKQQGQFSAFGDIMRGEPGPYFTPSVDENGNISWTNNGDLPNPQTRNIKGPKGDPGEVTEAELNAALTPYRTAAAQDEIDAAQDTEIRDLKSTVNQKAPVIYDTASGAIASFDDGADGMPLKSLTVNIEPVQSGTGDPSPTNVRPISGWTGCNVTRTGKNLFDGIVESGFLNINTGKPVADENRYRCKNFIRVLPNTTYSIKNSNNAIDVASLRIYFYDKNKELIYTPSGDSSNYNITTPATCAYIKFFVNQAMSNYDHTICIVAGANNFDYIPSQVAAYPVLFPTEASTVYGGTLDATNKKLIVTHAYYNMENLEWLDSSSSYGARFRSPAIQNLKIADARSLKIVCTCYASNVGGTAWDDKSIYQATNYLYVIDNDYADNRDGFRASLTGQYCIYPLASPIVYDLTDIPEITTLLGTNNIWADCGDVTVEYPADTKLYIQKINAPTDDDMTADTQIASGKYFLVNNTLYLSTTVIPAGDTIIPGTNCTKTNLAEALNALNT